jgi:hypothetical protein
VRREREGERRRIRGHRLGCRWGLEIAGGSGASGQFQFQREGREVRDAPDRWAPPVRKKKPGVTVREKTEWAVAGRAGPGLLGPLLLSFFSFFLFILFWFLKSFVTFA